MDKPMSAREMLRPFLDAMMIPPSTVVEASVSARYENPDRGLLTEREHEYVEAVLTCVGLDLVPVGVMHGERLAGWTLTGFSSCMSADDDLVYEMALKWGGA